MSETVKAFVSSTAGDVASALEFATKYVEPRLVKVGNHPVDEGDIVEIVAVPKGVDIHSVKRYIDEYRDRPERRGGTAELQDLDSFIRHVSRFADQHSALFARRSLEAPQLLAVLDYHEGGERGLPRFGKHRALYKFPLSEEWQAWHGKDGQAMSQADFAAFLEDRIVDVMPSPNFGVDGQIAPADAKLKEWAATVAAVFAGASKLMELSRGMRLKADQTVHQAQNLSTGEVEVQFVEEHKGTDGKPLKVPTAFLICIPIFEFGPSYRIAARLRYRLAQGKIVWFYDLHRPDLSFDHAFREAVNKAAAETNLPLFLGSPEQA